MNTTQNPKSFKPLHRLAIFIVCEMATIAAYTKSMGRIAFKSHSSLKCFDSVAFGYLQQRRARAVERALRFGLAFMLLARIPI